MKKNCFSSPTQQLSLYFTNYTSKPSSPLSLFISTCCDSNLSSDNGGSKAGCHHHITHGMYLFLIPLVGIITTQISAISPQDLKDLWNHLCFNLISVIFFSTLIVFLSTLYFLIRPKPVYMVNFACYKPEEAQICPRGLAKLSSIVPGPGAHSPKKRSTFQCKIMERSGLGEFTYLPEVVTRVPPNPSMVGARKEAEVVMFGALDELFAKTNLKPKDVGILIVGIKIEKNKLFLLPFC